jgi:hypothetical protein
MIVVLVGSNHIKENDWLLLLLLLVVVAVVALCQYFTLHTVLG